MARIELSKSAFFHNLALLSNKLGSKQKLAIVLKDNAYGHGLLPMAELSSAFGLSIAIVRTYDEAEAIENYFEKIIILNPAAPYIDNRRYSLTVNDLSQIPLLPPEQKIELKIDTGMHRNGIAIRELEKAFKLILKRGLKLEGVMTHFRSADEMGSELFWQLQNWQNVKKRVRTLCQTAAIPVPSFHSANSAATLRLQHHEDDFARCGIAAYGYHQMPESFGAFDLQPVLKLFARKITTTTLEKGERIGYGGSFTAPHKMKVSTYDIGYGDGFFRFDGKGMLHLAGEEIVGKISMDSLTAVGDKPEICLIKNAKEIADRFGTISYDVLVKLNPAITRIVTD